jgi:hypothetical protein
MTSYWSYPDDALYGSYVPRSGSLKVKVYSEPDHNKVLHKISTTVNMTLTAKNVTAIKKYNKDNKAYLACDVTSVRKGGKKDSVNATSVISNLPNPKYDLENDNFLSDNRKEESETVVLGTVSAKSYYMETFWDDLRTGDTNDAGKFQCQFNMSTKGVFDYNNYITSSRIQATMAYCKDRGKI